ncbi:hypothetical protein CE91St54_12160 [Hungatella hathewayi]|uniref:Uncharacterized protein n=1 Tax=Hungatella hathewayi TaxID=154046 RepID=A0AA37JCT0_9FIRM|nr:hypothetical protein CE91St55_12660 [Hungatella hathewayi]GKH06108.1 hypothetical protein CE91St54_12160 [Hungatella hathewayi]
MFHPGFLILFLKSMAWKFSGIIKSGMWQKAASVSKTPPLTAGFLTDDCEFLSLV